MKNATIEPPATLLRRVRMELAREPGHPEGSRNIGYEFIAPVSHDGHIVEDAYHNEVGHVVRKRGGAWAFHYDIHGDPAHDDTGFKLNSHRFVPGEYVSIREPDGRLKTYRIITVLELD